MTEFVPAGRQGIRNLTRCAGRDSRSQFWFYVMWLVIAQQVLSLVVMCAVIMVDFTSFVHPIHLPSVDPSTETSTHLAIFGSIATIVVVSMTLFVFMLIEAIIRRLHDSNLRGWWGMLPFSFLLFGFVAMVSLFVSFQPPSTQLFTALMVNNLIYLGTVIALIVLLCRPSTARTNRFGEQPL